MHVVARTPQIPGRSIVNWLSFITTSKEVAPLAVSPIKSLSVGAEQPFHSKGKVRLRCFENEMKMIGQQTVSMSLPTRLEAGFREGVEELVSVVIIEKNRFTLVTSTGDMIESAFVLNPEGTGHGAMVSEFQVKSQFPE